jgi:hypothetical protein
MNPSVEKVIEWTAARSSRCSAARLFGRSRLRAVAGKPAEAY